MIGAPRPRRGGARIQLYAPPVCLVLALAALALPVALVWMPPLLDYPNHLARMWLLAGGIDQPPLPGIYAVDWSGASTNIGVDLLAAALGPLVGAEALAKLVLAAALIVPPLGAALLNRAAFGGWHWWQVGFALLAWNATLVAGFLNFQAGLGLALLAAAADRAIVRRAGPLGAAGSRAALGAALLVWHLFAGAFYGALVAGLAFGADRAPFSGAVAFARAALRSAAAACFALAVPLGIFLLVAPEVPGGPGVPAASEIWGTGYALRHKLNVLRAAVVTYDHRVDAAFALALAIPAALGAVGWLAPSVMRLRAHAGLAVAALGLAALGVLVPSSFGGTALVDWRFPIMAALTGAAALRPDFLPSPRRRLAPLAACALLLVSLARTAWIAGIWRERQADAASVERALARVPAGAAVLPAEHTAPYGTPAPRGRYFFFATVASYTHLPAFAVPWRRAFVPTLFTAPGKQPLRVLPPWRSISATEGVPAPVDFLASFETSPWSLFLFGFAAHWREHFHYVLVVNADLPHLRGEPPLPEVELVADEGFARLYRNLRAPGGAAPAAAAGD